MPASEPITTPNVDAGPSTRVGTAPASRPFMRNPMLHEAAPVPSTPSTSSANPRHPDRDNTPMATPNIDAGSPTPVGIVPAGQPVTIRNHGLQELRPSSTAVQPPSVQTWMRVTYSSPQYGRTSDASSVVCNPDLPPAEDGASGAVNWGSLGYSTELDICDE